MSIKRVLSCDSGGIKGVLSLCFLEHFEKETGKSCHELFDLFVGTSTGAIIAGSLAYGLTASEVLEMYEEMAILIFSEKLHKWWKPWTYITQPKYHYAPMERTLKTYFKDTNIFDPTFPKKVLMFAKDLSTSENVFFNNNNIFNPETYDEHVKRRYDSHGTLYKIITASAVAPTFFPPYGTFVDGGVGVYGNPVYQAALEAVYYYGWKKVEVYSIGTGIFNNRICPRKIRKMNIFDWVRYIIGEALQDANEQQTAIASSMVDVKLRRYNIDFPKLYKQGVIDTDIKLSMDASDKIPYLIKLGREIVKDSTFYTDTIINRFPK